MPPPDPVAEQLLLDQARAGDPAAAARLFAEYLPYLRRLVECRLDPRVRARVDPSDILQEAHVEAVRRMPDYLDRPAVPLRLWLRRIAYDRLLMLQRRHRRAARRSVDREAVGPDQSSADLAARLVADGSTPSRHMVQAELARRVRTAVDRLAGADREVVLMRNYEGLSNQEVAAALGVTPVAASQRYGRALLRLRQLLAGDDPAGGRP